MNIHIHADVDIRCSVDTGIGPLRPSAPRQITSSRMDVRTWEWDHVLGIFLVLPGVQVWNADFRQQMVHQGSLYWKGLTLHILLCHQQVSGAHGWRIGKVCAQCCVVVFNMSKFIPNNEHSRTGLIFGFNLKKTAAKSYFEKIMVNVLHCKIRVSDGCGVSKVVISVQDKNEDKVHGKSPKNVTIWNCKHCLTKMIRKHKNNSPSNWVN